LGGTYEPRSQKERSYFLKGKEKQEQIKEVNDCSGFSAKGAFLIVVELRILDLKRRKGIKRRPACSTLEG